MTTPYAFESLLAGEIRRFRVHHRALGKRFDNEESALKLLDRFLLEHRAKVLADITPALLEAFLASRLAQGTDLPHDLRADVRTRTAGRRGRATVS